MRRQLSCHIFLTLVLLASVVLTHGHHHKPGGKMPSDHVHSHLPGEEPPLETSNLGSIFSSKLDFLFFGASPAVNSFLATFYISVIPNILLLFVPSNIKASSLNILVSFAIGGLLGDVFLHLLPHAFLEDIHDTLSLGHEHLTKRNICLGLATFFGLVLFYIMDKVMRIVSGDSGHSHNHSHSHSHSSSAPAKVEDKKTKKSSARKRKGNKEDCEDDSVSHKEPVQTIKHSAYLNLIADFSHNFTDGIAISASFYHSKSIGISTTLAVFLHEIPHEVGDFAILLQAGFSRVSAMYSQFITAIGAFLGTLVGVYLQEVMSSASSNTDLSNSLLGLVTLPIPLKDLVLPITAGGFLYIATVSVIPDLLQTPEDLKVGEKEHANPSTQKLLNQLVCELFSMFLGVSLMALVSLAE